MIPPNGPQQAVRRKAGETSDERRTEVRQAAEAAVLVIPKENERPRFWAEVRDISRGGMFLATEEPIPEDTVFWAKIVPRNAPAVRALARVVHTHHPKGVGCSFVDLSSAARQSLDVWLGRTGGLPAVSGVIDPGGSR
ncbi:MAG: PilZ domain-containing protein [Deltaproteobacteria bacterium]|nr:PilZ domain-containing protein [Deltaproteobacteria bacterium]